MDVADIARGLTKADRRNLFDVGSRALRGFALRRLLERKLVEYRALDGMQQELVYTPLGLAVRDYLLSQEATHGE